MQRLDSKTRVGLLRAFYQSGNSPSSGVRRYKTENNLRKDPYSVSTVTRLIDKFETFGCICDRPRSGRPSFSDERIEDEGAAFIDTSKCCKLQECCERFRNASFFSAQDSSSQVEDKTVSDKTSSDSHGKRFY